MSESTCTRCEGSGRIANTDDGEPWSAWESLPPGSDMAVRLGLVKPIPCPDCAARAEQTEPLIDPDCKAGKCATCVGGPCEHHCHNGSQSPTSEASVNLSRLYVRGDRIPAEVLELVRKWGTAQEGEQVSAAAANAAIAHEREAVGWQVSVGDDVTHAEWNGEVRQAGVEPVRRYRQVPAEGPLDWSQVTIRPDDDRPVEFPPASVLDPAPAERLASTVAEVRALRLLAEQSRRDALHAAALVYQGCAHDVGTETILLAADDFAAWLRDEPLPVPDPTRIPTEVEAARLGLVPPVEDIRPPLVEVNGSGVWRVAGHTFTDLRDLDADVAEQLALRLDAALAEDRVERGTGPLVRTALAILRRQR